VTTVFSASSTTFPLGVDEQGTERVVTVLTRPPRQLDRGEQMTSDLARHGR